MPVYNVFWKAIQPNGSSRSGGKTVTASTILLAENQAKAKVQQKWPQATIVITDIKQRNAIT